MTLHRCKTCGQELQGIPYLAGRPNPRLDLLAQLLESGAPAVVSAEWFAILGYKTPHALTNALKRDSRFKSFKSGVMKWELWSR
jgi:hypothetical protein